MSVARAITEIAVAWTASPVGRDQVLEFLGDFEDRNASLRHGRRLTRARVARDASLAVLHLERPEATDLQVLALRQGVRHRLEELIHGLCDLLLRQSRFGSDVLDDFGLGHGLLPSAPRGWLFVLPRAL